MKTKIIKTFVQAALGSFFTTMGGVMFTDVEALKAGLLAAAFTGLSTGVCAVMNIPAVAKWFNNYGEQ